MRDFAAIDFETANNCRTSVCSVGLVTVENGIITDRYYHLIRPLPDYYLPQTTAIHGLTWNDTAGEPEFPEIWSEIAPKIRHIPLVAHNKSFDESCLKAVFRAYGMEYPGYRFLCTLAASRRVFGKSLPDHRLHTVAAACGYDLTRHHHALADAEACAAIAIRLL